VLDVRFFNIKHGFDDWKNRTNPDAFELLKPTKEEAVLINRIGQ
jgi:hypothetical protein